MEEKSLNLKIQEFKEDLTETINKHKMPVGIVQMVLQETLSNVIQMNTMAIAQERQKLKEGEKDGEKIHKT